MKNMAWSQRGHGIFSLPCNFFYERKDCSKVKQQSMHFFEIFQFQLNSAHDKTVQPVVRTVSTFVLCIYIYIYGYNNLNRKEFLLG